jgi:hypothetical protein
MAVYPEDRHVLWYFHGLSIFDLCDNLKCTCFFVDTFAPGIFASECQLDCPVATPISQ